MKTPEIRKYHIGSTKRSDDIFEILLLTPRITTKVITRYKELTNFSS
ncbi:286_t:CDS:2 [Funneliformis caledonium]|uniref:286_t:CDS:1 n=1 Tax=Funneliformis caledonium TaxID=1117310 RepID=A0A9N8VX49_9GLOM|nr:286_t:CDS:2 [Funneliformis caledonium]